MSGMRDRRASGRAGQALMIQVAIALAALVLVLVTWAFTRASIATEEHEARARVESSVANLALAVEWQLDQQWQSADQTLRQLQQVDLGRNGLIALVGGDGLVRAQFVAGEAKPGANIAGSELFEATMQGLHGIWTGPSAPDHVVRVHAFRRLRDQDLTIVVGMDAAEAFGAAQAWSDDAGLFAGAVSAALLLSAVLLILQVAAATRREVLLARDRSLIEDSYGELATAKASAEAKTAQIETVLAGMSDGVMMLDAECRLVHWNDRFPQCTGIPGELLRPGQSMAVLLRAQAESGEFGPVVEVEAEVRRRMAVLLTTRGTMLAERVRPDGSTLEIRRSRLANGGFVTLYTDISARKRAAEAQLAARKLVDEATEQKSRFVAIVSHEIRTPLNAVVNSLALLDETGLSLAQRRLAETAREAGDALMELVSDILELSNTEAGKLVLRPSVFELRPLLDGAAAMFQSEAERRGVRLVVELAPQLPPQLRADAGRLRQVMMNLISNATKFSAPGMVTIRAATLLVAGETVLALSVEDQGPLIPQAEAAQLFVPFSRLDNARAAGTPGTGLGLAICERLVRLMRGQIGLRQAAGGGNEFWVTLPLEAATSANALPAGATAALTRRRRSFVLLVEDIPANHLVTATLLRREGHKVDVAESGQEAIEMARRQPYDIVLMDLIMPGMGGLEAARRIRELPGPAARIPIVALTATTSAEDRARCLAAGMDDMLGKPVRPLALFAMLERFARETRGAPAPASAVGANAAGGVGDDGPVLDAARLTDLRKGLPANTLVSLVDQCLDDMRVRMATLRAALSPGDARAIEVAAHALAGMAGSYGLAAMDRRMRRIIQAARADDLAGAATSARGMESDLAVAAEAIRMHLRAAAA